MRDTAYEGFTFAQCGGRRPMTLTGDAVQQLFHHDPLLLEHRRRCRPPADLQSLTTEIGFRYLVYQKQSKASPMRAGFFCAYWQ